jgi:hypothetical protein
MLWTRLRLRFYRPNPRRRPAHLRPVDQDERPRWYH